MSRSAFFLLSAFFLGGHQAVAVAQAETMTLDELKARTRELEQIRNDLILDASIRIVRMPPSPAKSAMGAELEKILSANAPRKLFVGTKPDDPNVEAYVQAVVKRIESTGTETYPEAAKGRLSGKPVISLEIDAQGKLLAVTLSRSSGQAVLDDAALEAVRLAAPFAPFPVEVRVVADVMDITREFTYTAAQIAPQ
jgi:TonB family protein